MQANPSKFQCILIGSKEKENLQLSESITLDVVDSVKLLGVDIDKKLTFSSHKAHICKKPGLVNIAMFRGGCPMFLHPKAS